MTARKPAPIDELLTAARARQVAQWRDGDTVTVETLLASFPALTECEEEVLVLICGEAQLRAERGETPPPAEYQARFPHLAERIELQFAVLGELSATDQDATRPPDPESLPAVKLVVTAGPHVGTEFAFDRHDTFLVGRTSDAHFRLSYDDPYFSRRHFLVEVHPPRIRVFDLNSRNGISVNGVKVRVADLKDGDELRAGHTVFRVAVPQPQQAEHSTRPEAIKPVTPLAATDTVAYAGGPQLPDYQLLTEIGHGAMGTVYRAVRKADGLQVAVKLITPTGGVTQRQLDRFLREAVILEKLDHRNIVRYLDRGQCAGQVYLVMEAIDGPDAAKLVKRGGVLDVPAATRLIGHALEGLAHAHAKGFVHRDVKPANILIGREAGKRVVKVADFGLARAFDTCGLSGSTMQGEVGGTPAFMAPEQVTHYRDVKPAADQYSAAATLYFLLTGKFVLNFAAEASEHLVQIITEKPVPIRSRRPELPERLAEVIHKALASDPADRYPDVTAFRKALKPFAK